MADICMCKGKDENRTCARRKECYRYTAKANLYRQSYFVALPVINNSVETGNFYCPHFVRVIRRG